ncbi:hypothetical protein Pint_04445 [Pistacia integerrima]|uniref:Uncharacterized protein n=1 Tax=Pistacia integerrima TaxID=434235 RepID=A0ACC0Z5B5_9ROSI|nr:hypothetical protein Pint_04445 [Pistacia integerrima]
MWVLSCAIPSAYPAHLPKASLSTLTTVRSSSLVSVPTLDHPFVPEVVKAVDSLYPEFRAVDNLVARNTSRVLKAFQNARVGSHHFGGSTGYGHDEAGGREALDQVFAEIVGAESAIVRSQFFSGTHAITCALFAFLRPGDETNVIISFWQLLVLPMIPWRKLLERGTLLGWVLLKILELSIEKFLYLAEDGGLDWDALGSALRPHTKCALIQRSCGYSWRQSLSVDEIGKAIKIIKMQNPNCFVMVDNCYGEFVEMIEPPMVGADLIAGSLIKNPGGTIAPCGGYVAGRRKWVEAAAARLSAPGLGIDCGSTPGDIMRAFFQGLFLSPQMVGEAVKGTLLVAEVMASKGYKVQPLPRVPRHDTVQAHEHFVGTAILAVQLGSREHLLAFCEAVQRSSPVGSFTKPIAGTTPGYASEVIFADGTFIDGSTSELSCDGPLREPFTVFCQGGTHWIQWGLVLGEVLKTI